MKRNKLHLLSRLSAYTAQSVFIRLTLVSGVGLLFFFLSIKITDDPLIQVTFQEYLQVVLIFVIIGESNVFVDHMAERILPIPEKLSLRVILHFVVSFLIAVAAISYFSIMVKDTSLFSYPVVQLMILLGLIFTFIIIVFSVALRITEKWIFSVRQLEELKSLKLKSDYNLLQSQLNPHFLFNNLSVLKSMITYNPEAAISFTQNFTDVYRYVLQSRDKTTVKLADELEFIEAYASVHKERMGEAFKLIVNVRDEDMKKEIPPLALQLLVENAIKHNIAIKDTPLVMNIISENNTLSVRNNVNLKESVVSEKTGLENLRGRYFLLTERAVEVNPGNEVFEVKIPLL